MCNYPGRRRDRLDKGKKGELDARKLAQSNLSAATHVGK
jgi:hypothetical protein